MLHELRPPDLGRLASAGEVRRIRQGPRTIEEVLARARAQMDEEDRLEELARDPVAWMRAHRPRHRLIDRLLYGRR
jgi:hypothetical protein